MAKTVIIELSDRDEEMFNELNYDMNELSSEMESIIKNHIRLEYLAYIGDFSTRVKKVRNKKTRDAKVTETDKIDGKDSKQVDKTDKPDRAVDKTKVTIPNFENSKDRKSPSYYRNMVL